MARQMNLQLVISADGRAVAPVTAEVRREVSSVGEAGRAAAADVALLAAANDEAAAASRRAMEAMRGQATAERDLRASIERSVGVRPALDDAGYRQRQADIAAFGAELDRLRAKFVPAAAAEQSLLAVQNEINRAFKVGAIDAKEQAAALEMARLAHDHTAAAAARQAEEYRRLAAAGREAWAADQAQARFNSFLGIGTPAAGSARASADVFAEAGLFDEIAAGADRAAQSTALATHEMTNLTYQMNDIVLMLASGQSPFLMMMQQGSQITQIMGQRGLGEILPALGGALTKLISPTTMFLASITAAGYAGYYAFRRIVPEAKNAEDVLARHADLVRDIEQSYTQATNAADRFGRESQSILLYQAEQAKRDLADLLVSGAKDTYVKQLGPGMFGFEALDIKQYLPADWIGQASTLGPIYDAIMRLNEEAKSGIPNIAAYRQELVAIANDRTLSASIRERADALLKESEELAKLHRQWRGFRADVSSTGMLFGRALQEAHSLNDLGVYESGLRVSARRAEEAFAADMLDLTARSPAERAAAARAQAAALRINDEHPDERRHRIELAERRALAEAEHALAEAQRERGIALQETLELARLEVALTSRHSAEVERSREEMLSKEP